jgi:hypothetical protein
MAITPLHHYTFVWKDSLLRTRQTLLRAHERQITRLSARRDEILQRSANLTRWRLLVFIAGFIATLVAFNSANTIGITILAVSVLVFGGLVAVHRRVQRAADRMAIWQRMKYEALARMQLHWNAIPEALAVPVDTSHPFAYDLDILGEFSLYGLLDTTGSLGGSRRLVTWLLRLVPDAQVILKRQSLIGELTPLTGFRDRLMLAMREGNQTTRGEQHRWDGDRILSWLHSLSDSGIQVWQVALLLGLAVVNLVLFVLDATNVLPQYWVATVVAYWFVMLLTLRGLGDLFNRSLSLQSELERMAAAFESLEQYHYPANSQLAALCQPFKNEQTRPARQLQRVRWIVSGMSLSRNPVLWLWLNTLLPWDVLFAYLLQGRVQRLSTILPTWLEAFYEVESLNALASFAHLHPEYTFPILDQEPQLIAQQIGHPLLPDETRVANDFSLSGLGSVVIVTGSNMSGKSSFLRTLGVNLCLTYAGSVVAAESLQAALLRLFTCIRVSDSVVDGISYFYAEVQRLKALLDALETHQTNMLPPVFFLIDEIFKGTNNRERLIGSREYIRALTNRYGLGLISTHDLELTQLENELSQVSNLHFREDIRDGRMSFDYRLRSGPSPTTNALKIMALEGLPIDDHLLTDQITD